MSSLSDTQSLLQWGLSAAGAQLQARDVALDVVAGDASSRRYFRFTAGQCSYVLVDAPPATEKNAAFVAIQGLLDKAGVRVPAVHACDLQRGYLLLEDLGNRLLLPALDSHTVDQHYHNAFQILLRLTAVDPGELAPYDEALLGEELGRFPEWFAQGLLGCPVGVDEVALLDRLGAVLIASALEQPRVLVHRDFHSRNLMLMAGDELAVIDFQDAVAGPLTYDLVSLLRDCYICWSAERVDAWALQYRGLLEKRAVMGLPDEDQFLRWFDLMGLQRHIKVLGTFARLYLRDGKAAYLSDLPGVIRYTLRILEKYAGEETAMADALNWFNSALAPRINTTNWGDAL